jgi:hypothetical protein
MQHIAFASAIVGLTLMAGSASAQQNKYEQELVGHWINTVNLQHDSSGAEVQPFGPHPLGAYMFDTGGHYMQIIVPDKDSTAKGYVATFGTYSVSEDGKNLVLHFTANASPRLDGTGSRRDIVSLTDDELKFHNGTPQLAGASNPGSVDSTWRRAK